MSRPALVATLLACLLAFVAAPSISMAARAPSSTQAVTAETLEDFQHQAARVRAEMAAGKRYADLSKRDLRTVERTLDEIHVLLERSESVAAMNEEQKTNLINLQERANAILTANAQEELICEWVKKTGSNRRQRVCITAHERDRMREEANRGFSRRNPSHKNQGG